MQIYRDMANINLFLDIRRMKKDGTYPVKMNLWFGQQLVVKTGFSASKERWNGTEFSKKESNYQQKNIRLRNIMNAVESFFIKMEEEGRLGLLDKSDIKRKVEMIISGKEERKVFSDYIQEVIDNSSKENTKSIYRQTKEKVDSFDKGCTFERMDIRWLSRFERWLQDSGMRTNSISIHMRNIRAVFNYAIDNGDTTAYPFRKFKIKKEATRKRALSLEELRTLRDYDGEKFIREYQDIFMLMFYLIGINSVDLFGATLENIVNGRIEYKREKTGRLYSIKIEPEAMEIINKYKGKHHLLYVEDVKEYRTYCASMSRGLKKLGEMEIIGRGGKKRRNPIFPNISPYWARHTWATIAASLDIPKETISAALGHEIGSSVTSIYIDFEQKKVDEANRKVIDYVNGGGRVT